ncbi:hypothetical protein T05_4920 [Trichinella murrelli]|uniref:Uncharacterized protein n=1 Tax=Trichinella murrelli TaxID=144512 RepID=A0A0V0U9L9_9BILA|nr:hypothetical protein T05_4920 [Trichinella murrelli]
MENLANKPSKRVSVCFPAPFNIDHSEDRRMNTPRHPSVCLVWQSALTNFKKKRELQHKRGKVFFFIFIEILIMGKKVPPTWWKMFEDDRPTLIGGSFSLVFQITLNSDECLRGFDF